MLRMLAGWSPMLVNNLEDTSEIRPFPLHNGAIMSFSYMACNNDLRLETQLSCAGGLEPELLVRCWVRTAVATLPTGFQRNGKILRTSYKSRRTVKTAQQEENRSKHFMTGIVKYSFSRLSDTSRPNSRLGWRSVAVMVGGSSVVLLGCGWLAADGQHPAVRWVISVNSLIINV